MNVAQLLQEKDVRYELLPHRETHDALRMARTLHVPGRSVAKTVLIRADHGYRYIVAVLPADKSIDWEQASRLLGGSELGLASEAEVAEHCPDCQRGVLPPFGSQYGMKTIADTALTEDEQIVFESNTHHEAIRMRLDDFLKLESPLVGTFAR